MIILPAIDIQDGKVVRLKQGRFKEATVYSEDPLAVAKKWISLGAAWLHVVDLDGAKTGTMKNFATIARIARESGVPIEVGGGIRGASDVEKLIGAGVQRLILSTSAVEDPTFLTQTLKRCREHIAISIDCLNGLVAQKGWTKVTQIKGIDFAKNLQGLGLQCLIYTDIKRDGMLEGPNLEGLNEILKAVQISVIASGGISQKGDVEHLLQIARENPNLIGAITGKAIYEGTLDLREAIELCSRNA